MPRLPRFLAALTAAAAVSAAPAGADMAADVASALQLPGVAAELESAFTAEAAIIRRGKIRKRGGIGYKVVVVTSEAPGDTPIAEVDAGFPIVGGNGGSIPPQNLTVPSRHRKHFKGMLTQWPATYAVTVTLGDGTAVTAPIDGLEPTVAGSETLVLLDAGFKAKIRIANDLQTKVVVFHEDKDWDPTIVTGVRVGDDTTFLDVPHQQTTARWVKAIPASDVPDDFADGSSYVIDVTATDASGAVVDQTIRGEVLGGLPSDAPILESARVKNKNGNVKVVTWTEGFNGKDNSVQTLIKDDTGAVLVSTLDDMPTRVARLYETRTLTFDDPSSAVDEPYDLVIDLFDSTGAVLGSGSVEVVVQGLILPDAIVGLTAATTLYADAGLSAPSTSTTTTTASTGDLIVGGQGSVSLSPGATADSTASGDATSTTATTADTVDQGLNPDGVPFTVDINGETVKGVAAIVQLDATNFVLGVMVATDAASIVDANIIPISGPSPDPEVVSMAPVSEYKKYVSVGDTGIGTLDSGGSADLMQVLLNEEGGEEDIVFVFTWADFGTRPYKKRPGAPKGRLRSPKVNPTFW